MRFADLVAAYERLAATTKRLEMRAELSRVLKGTPPDELPEVVYLSQGLLRPEYEGIELGLADSLARRAVAEAAGSSEETVRRHVRDSGDLGQTACDLLTKGRGSAEPTDRSVEEVYAGFRAIADARGDGAQERKIAALVELLRGSTPVEAKYVIRFALGTLRLGVREMTIVDALVESFGGGTKESRSLIESAFNISSDLGHVAKTLAESGLDGLNQIRLTVGRPIRPMLAERAATLAELLERMGPRAALEYKYDGLRIQAHIPEHGEVSLFSRRLELISGQFPEIVAALPGVLRNRPAIVEGECVSVDLDTGELRPFQEISRRRGRKYDLERMQSEVPVRIFLFDLLLEGKEETFRLDFPERRKRLERLLRPDPQERVVLATQETVSTEEEAHKFFDRAIADGCEGVMAKSLAEGSGYRAGARGFWWIKYKREYTLELADTIDGVVVGAFAGRGRRGGKWGALLMATYNPAEDRFESFCKVGSGFDDAFLAALPERLRRYELDSAPAAVLTGLTPDRWFRPAVVLELRGAELSLSPIHRAAYETLRPGAGLALRFPRFTGRWREDKGPTDATTSSELVRMYQSQVRRSGPPESPSSAES